MNIIPLPRQRMRTHPVVCFVDLQVEYVSSGRALAVEETEPWTGNCRRLLAFAREQRLPIAHFRQLRRGPFFNPATEFAGWIEEFRPRPSEMVFERSMPSCYAAGQFPQFTDNMDNPFLVIAGLTSTGACLATALDAAARNHSALFVSDASWTTAFASADAGEANALAAEIIGQYCEVMPTAALIEWLLNERMGIAS